MNKKIVSDVDVKDKQVLIRVDFNVPLEDGAVGDDTRIEAALPTIRYCLDQGASVVLMSHLGRPKGEIVPAMSLKPVVPVLSEKLGLPVKFAPDCVGPEVKKLADELVAGEVLLLENLRFHAEEEGKDKDKNRVEPEKQDAFARELAELGDVFINDAFGTAHRAHASMAVVTKYFEDCAAGFLMQKEIDYLHKALEAPERPFVAIIGGAKISGKIDVVTSLLEKVDALIIGGGMAYTFYLGQGLSVGNSIVEPDKVELAKSIEILAKEKGVNLVLPSDNIVADDFSNDANTKVAGLGEIEDGWEGLDIGPKSIEAICAVIRTAKTVVWNGPMGCFEMDNFAAGTRAVADAIAETDCVSIIGGGDSVAAINQFGLADKMTHISTGGGASLEFLEGKALPGVVALSDK